MHYPHALMLTVHEFLKNTAFDLYELHLFRLVAVHGNFTRAASAAGLTQSAMTRQVQALEQTLGVELLQRTTRKVQLTAAGEFLLNESVRLLGDAEQSIRRLKEEFSSAKKVIRIGVSRSIPMAHLPGFFHANIRNAPEVGYRVSYATSAAVLAAVEASELDLGVVSQPLRLPKTLAVTHRFVDAFTLIANADLAAQFNALPKPERLRREWLQKQNWLMFDERTNTGQRLHAWIQRQGWKLEPTMQLDSFDLVINLAAIGMGIAFAPIRALALYNRKKNLVRIPLKSRFERELVVVTRRNRVQPKHVTAFIEHILF
jgi:DNA-binding transcriptional LysR family regulator